MAEFSELSIQQIYDELQSNPEGLVVSLPSLDAVKSLRSSLSTYRSRQEERMLSLDMPFSPQSIETQTAVNSSGNILVKLKLRDKAEPTTFKIVPLSEFPDG